MSAHTGTHIDSPGHFVQVAYETGRGVEALSLNVLMDPALVVDVPCAGGTCHVTAAALEALALPAGTERLVLKTDNTRRGLWGQPAFRQDYAGVTADGAEWLVRRGIKLVAIDYLSLCTFEDLKECHVTLLEKNVHIVEGLDLSRVAPGLWNLLALPMSVAGSDGAPARVLMSRL